MNKNVFVSMFLLMTTGLKAQDMIVKKNGDEVKAKVISVEDDKVSYKRWSNVNGPTYTISTNKIFMIKYANGEKDVFNAETANNAYTTTTNTNTATGYIEKQPAANNAELTSRYNPVVQFNLKPTNSNTVRLFPILAMDNTSILSNEDIEISFIRQTPVFHQAPWYHTRTLRYYIEIKNKTNHILYIDKGNSFKSIDNIAIPFFDSKQVSISNGSGSGASLGLGAVAGALGIGGIVGQLASGVSIGGGTSTSIATTYSQQRILAIPPHSSTYMSELKYEEKEFQKISDAESFEADYKGEPIKKGQYKEFGADNSPHKYSYFITYSTSPDFATYSSVNAKLYIKYIVGAATYDIPESRWSEIYRDANGTHSVNGRYSKVITNFVSEPFMIVGKSSKVKF